MTFMLITGCVITNMILMITPVKVDQLCSNDASFIILIIFESKAQSYGSGLRVRIAKLLPNFT